ncbi:MAG: SDR family oxidoreductase [bacterium]
MRVLVSGASGLLGMALTAQLRAAGHAVDGLCHRSAGTLTRAADLLDPRALAALDSDPWDAVVNLAAYRSPDQCEAGRKAAWRLNAEMPGELAALAARRGARCIHISTDYVFPGTHPPYSESDPADPVNYYGVTKAASERVVAEADPAAVILRIPALYGNPPSPLLSPLLEEGLLAARSKTAIDVDDRIVRHPTWTEDIACVIVFLLERSDVTGVLQASAPEAVTRYGWTLAIAGILGLSSAHLRPVKVPSCNVRAVRPVDAHLSVERLRALGGPVPRGFSVVLPDLLRARLARETPVTA